MLQFTGDLLADAQRPFRSSGSCPRCWRTLRRGIEFHGHDAGACGELLIEIGASAAWRGSGCSSACSNAWSPRRTNASLASETYRPELTVGGDAQIGAVIEYIFGHVNDVRMSTAAGILGMNELTFSRHFKKMTGNNFVDCARKIRIAKACTLLESDALSVTDICFECGFQNIPNFNPSFRHAKGMTPREYRSWVKMRQADRLSTNSSMYAPTRSHDDNLTVCPPPADLTGWRPTRCAAIRRPSSSAKSPPNASIGDSVELGKP